MNWRPFLHGGLLLVEILILVWIAKKILGLILRRNIDKDLITLDNPAVAITLSGYLLAVFIAVSGLVYGTTGGIRHDLIYTAIYGGIAIFCLLFSMLGWAPFLKVYIDKEIFNDRNVGVGVVAFGALVATALIFKGSLTGSMAPGLSGGWQAILVFFVLGQLALFLTALTYQWITPYDIHKEINDNSNLAVALGYAGALLATGIIVQNATSGDMISWEESLRDFARMLIPLLLFWPVRWLIVNGLLLNWGNVNKEVVQDKNVGAGILEAITYIGIALFAVHLLG
jgi:uncharacterized membrane protein YjfL (UPF0719 family)